jgi:serine/threonine protein kinase
MTSRTAELKPKLVALKLFRKRHTWKRNAKQEIRSLQAITKASGTHPSGKLCTTLLVQDLEDNSWLGTPAILGGLTLASVFEAFVERERVPEEFVWHIYIQLTDALKFLHHVCEPNVPHGDLHMNNVLIDVGAPRLSHPGFPQIKVIDFGGRWRETDVAGKLLMDADRNHLYSVLAGLYAEAESCHCTEESHKRHHDEWHSFGQTCYDESVGEYCNPMSLEEMWEQYGEIAVSRRKATPERVLQKIKEVVFDVGEANIKATEKLIQDKLSSGEQCAAP